MTMDAMEIKLTMSVLGGGVRTNPPFERISLTVNKLKKSPRRSPADCIRPNPFFKTPRTGLISDMTELDTEKDNSRIYLVLKVIGICKNVFGITFQLHHVVF